MHKKSGMIFVIAGTVLIFSALSLFIYNQYEDKHAGQAAESQLSDIQSFIQENKTASSIQPEEINSSGKQETEFSENCAPGLQGNPKRELPVIEIDGYEYIGYLSIPELELELPVMSEWDYKRLKIAPCRQFGSSITDDLVIAAHNYKRHFGNLSKLKSGASVFFTDMDGIKNEYEIVLVKKVSPTEVEAVQNSGHDLVLYTCTYGGSTRIAAFCDRVE